MYDLCPLLSCSDHVGVKFDWANDKRDSSQFSVARANCRASEASIYLAVELFNDFTRGAFSNTNPVESIDLIITQKLANRRHIWQRIISCFVEYRQSAQCAGSYVR